MFELSLAISETPTPLLLIAKSLCPLDVFLQLIVVCEDVDSFRNTITSLTQFLYKSMSLSNHVYNVFGVKGFVPLLHVCCGFLNATMFVSVLFVQLSVFTYFYCFVLYLCSCAGLIIGNCAVEPAC
jgi:hypothetical protein